MWQNRSSLSFPACFCRGESLLNDFLLPADLYSDTLAVRRDPAFRTVRANRLAQILPVSDEQIVEDNPVSGRELTAQGHLGFLGRARADVTESIGDPVHMRIDSDPRLPEA